MLKVVGASWQKTRIGTYILIGAGLLVIGAFFIVYIDRPIYDGTYCATAFWTKQFGFQIEYWKQQNDLLNIPKGAARICYKDSIFENGWAQIEVETQRTYPDWVQAYGAGILEGSLTWNNIYNQWENTISAACGRDENSKMFCEWLRNLLTENYDKMKENAQLHGEIDHYWHQISLFFSQLEGLETGYMRGAKRARSDLEEEIPFSDFLMLNAAADIQDLRIYFENYVLNATNQTEPQTTDNAEAETASTITTQTTELSKSFDLPSAIMLTKIFQNDNSSTWKLLFGHSTAGSYASMLRIQKRYKFHYHFTPNHRTNTVPGVDISFTGYPGILGSTDDFYIVKGRQVQSIVAGVGIKYDNLALWKAVNVQAGITPLVARVMAANRISQNRRTWAKAMGRHPATGSKQWITVDLNKLSPQGNLFVTLSEDEKHDDAGLILNAADEAALVERQNRYKGLVWIAEQIPGRVHFKDVSEQFLIHGNSTWLARGIPYFDEILTASGVPEELQEAETEILNAATIGQLQNLESVDKFLRSQGFRGDLIGDEPVAYGNIDIKLFSYNAKLGMSDYHAFAGPIFMHTQHIQARAVTEATMSSSSTFKTKTSDGEIVTSAVKDDRISVMIDDAGDLSELERISERRPVRNDMRAIALRLHEQRQPFQWSDVIAQLSETGHNGQPDKWDFDHISPAWSW